MSPKVTVIMPVYNGEKYLNEAIKSIIMQSFTDFEFLIINDGSTDNSVDIIRSFSDPRIKVIDNSSNIGQADSLNKGISLARGEYIIRMDADDISLPERIEKQVAFMDANHHLGISGTWVSLIGDRKEKWNWLPIDFNSVKTTPLFRCPLMHPTVILRRHMLISNNLFYRSFYETAEDYDL